MRVIDDFVWLLVDHKKALAVYYSNLFPLYVLHPDESEALVEDADEIRRSIDLGLEFGIEVGNLNDLNND